MSFVHLYFLFQRLKEIFQFYGHFTPMSLFVKEQTGDQVSGGRCPQLNSLRLSSSKNLTGQARAKGTENNKQHALRAECLVFHLLGVGFLFLSYRITNFFLRFVFLSQKLLYGFKYDLKLFVVFFFHGLDFSL